MRSMIETVRDLLAYPKGLLAMDESNATCDKRFAAAGIPQTVEARRAYRELLITAPGLNECVSGVILYDETIRQSRADGTGFIELIEKAGIVPGIKVDVGAEELAGHAGEKVTEGLDGLRKRLRDYSKMGARFAKWRAVIAIGERWPSRACVEANAHALARYAALCQEAGIVPIVEPETVMDGGHSMAACADTTQTVLRALFAHLAEQGVALEALILKPNMVLPGAANSERPSAADVAQATLGVLQRVVPAEVPGVAFLSGGQSGELASARLSAMNASPTPNGSAPWTLTFSYARAIQQPALEIWGGRSANVQRAQAALLHRASCNRAAREGRYADAMEASAA